MDLDQEICLCFHVTRRKLENFIRLEKPRRVAQLSECFGAGTGCGWCRKYLSALFEAANNSNSDRPDTVPVTIPSTEQYFEMRREYRQQQSAKDSNTDDKTLGQKP